MPTYEYQCSHCKHRLEKFQSIMAPPLRKCPHCGKNTLKRLIGTGAGLIFKGSGFYITDYRSDSYKDAAKSDSGAKPSESKSGEAKPDAAAKPAEQKTSAPEAASKTPAPKTDSKPTKGGSRKK